MSFTNLEQFCAEVLLDPSLQEKLRAIGSKPEFVEQVVKTGGERGFVFSEEDVREAMRAGFSEWLVRWV